MKDLNSIKDKEEKLNEAVRNDFELCCIMCTGIVTAPDFFRRFPPKIEFASVEIYKPWLISAFYTAYNSIFSKDPELLDAIFEIEFKLLEEYDEESAYNNILSKYDCLMSKWGDIGKGLKNQADYVTSLMEKLGTQLVSLAVMWLFCKSVLQMITEDKINIDIDAGANILYKMFVNLIATSQAVDVYNTYYRNQLD